MHSVILLAWLAAAPAPEGRPDDKDPPARRALFAGEQWYKDQKGKEEEFVGVLKRVPGGGPGIGRFNPYRLVMTQGDRKTTREVYVGGKPDLLAPYVGKKVKLVGKAVELEVVGRTHHEIWPARLEVVAADPKPGQFEEVKGDDARELKVFARAPWRFGVQDGTRHQHVIRSAEELKAAAGAQADAVLKALKADNIDWKTQMVVLVSGGAQRTGGYSVEVTKLEVRDKALTVHWKLNTPRPGQPVTQALTHPAQTLLVERFDGPVKFDPPAAKREK